MEMRHITKRFPGIVANDDVSIQIQRGEVMRCWAKKRRRKEHAHEYALWHV